jgi:hypothetical protein
MTWEKEFKVTAKEVKKEINQIKHEKHVIKAKESKNLIRLDK